MARIRTIKPGYFTNVELSEFSRDARYLGIALLTMADRDGRLKDCPKSIKLGAFPWDDVDVDALLDELTAAKFLMRYVIDGARFLQILTFGKHQVPHVKEAPSSIPAPCEHSASTVPAPPGREGKGREQITPLPPKGELHEVPFSDPLPSQPDPDELPSLVLEEASVVEPPTPRARRAAPKPGRYLYRFEEWYRHYPKKRGRDDAERAWDKLKPDDAMVDKLIRCTTHQAAWPDWVKEDGAYVPLPATYLNGARWRDAEDELALKLVPDLPKPFHDHPWGPIWQQEGFPATALGVMNFALKVAPRRADPDMAGEIFRTTGFEAAVAYVMGQRDAG